MVAVLLMMLVMMEMVLITVWVVLLLLVTLMIRMCDNNNNGVRTVPYLFLHAYYLAQSSNFKKFVEGWKEQAVSLLKGNTGHATLHVPHPPTDSHFISVSTHTSCLGLCPLTLLSYHSELYSYHS